MRASALLILVGIVFSLPSCRATEPDAKLSVLTLKEAQAYALSHHPAIQAADFRAQAAEQRIRQERAAFFPQITANASAVGAQDDTRIAATGGLNNPTVLSRESNGLTISQLITDFGRTSNLTSSSRYNAYSAEQMAQEARARVLLEVSRAYFQAKGALAILHVADQTVSSRGLLLERVRALAKGNLKSSLDASFAGVEVSQAKLIQLKARSKVNEAFAELDQALGMSGFKEFELGDEPVAPPAPEPIDKIVEQALRDRPELVAARADWKASLKLAEAEKAAQYPVITAQGAVGFSPVHDDKLENDYAAAGVNIALPVVNGGRLSAKAEEARLRAVVSQKILSEEEGQIEKDVRIAWLDSKTAYEAIGVTDELRTNSDQALELAQSRYNLGVSSIVELSQAELQKVEAEISSASARYDYQIQRILLDYQAGLLR